MCDVRSRKLIYFPPMPTNWRYCRRSVLLITIMSRCIALLLCGVLPGALLAADDGYKVMYDGGSLSGVKSGSELRLFIEPNRIRFTSKKADVVSVAASSVTEISYGQDVHRRVGAA